MDLVDIARWQFGIVTVYHFWFVPITIGLTAIVAGFETAWVRKGNPVHLRLTKFFGKLLLINFAIGIATGIVQEFQFGMNWSDYSRFVGDIFGAPLAIEGLLAFFLESTFLGLWIFGWDKLPRGLHAACMWIVHLGTLFSSYWILAANSWMQHPVGYVYNEATGRAELTDFWAVVFNKVQLVTFPHVVFAAYMTAGACVLGVGAWLHLRAVRQAAKGQPFEETEPDPRASDANLQRTAMRVGAAVLVLGGLGVAISGDVQGKIMTEVQPMKMAAAEGLYETEESCAPFSIFTVGTPDGEHEKFAVTVPCLLSFLGTGSFDGEVEGINDLREKYEAAYGTDPGAAYYSADGYTPMIPVTYWSFRFMIGLGVFAAAGGIAVLWLTRKKRGDIPERGITGTVWLSRLAVVIPLATIGASSFGWIFTEMGRQPWAVFGLMTTDNAVSPGVSVTEAWISIISLTVLYLVLAIIEFALIAYYVRRGPEPFAEPRRVTWAELKAARHRVTGDDIDTEPSDEEPMANAY